LKIEAHGGVRLRFGWQPVLLLGLLVANYSAWGMPKGFGLGVTRVCDAIGETDTAFCCGRSNAYQSDLLDVTRHLAHVAGGCKEAHVVRRAVGSPRTAIRRSVGASTTMPRHRQDSINCEQPRCASLSLEQQGSSRIAKPQCSRAKTGAPHGTALARYGGHAA
jgi:hypothetical protein